MNAAAALNPPARDPADQRTTAQALGLLACPICELICRAGVPDATCPRCGEPLEARKSRSLARTTSYLAAAAILYLPANMFPAMNTTSAFREQRDTILSGVVSLWRDGDWPLSLLVLFASVVVPLFKIVALAYLVVSTKFGWRRRVRGRTRLYRFVEFVGRWSMLDIYVTTLLCAMVRVGTFSRVEAGPGALAFCAVVILTMMASMSFDPRLMWDNPAAATPAPAPTHPHA
jgi:paraquat-inducible protein A